ncbi:MAG: hypothetical protein KF699_11560 [Phycisphaeraceae bacterium]|nr:hypothetical protein [Phycisphaeraceae bacterium]
MNRSDRRVTGAFAAAAGLAMSAGALAQSADQVRAAVAEMMADAETRSSLLSAGDAGHDGAFFIAGDNFRLNIGGALQFRYIVSLRDDNNAPDDDFSNGFQANDTRINFGGTVHKDWAFFVEGKFDKEGGGFTLLDAYAAYTFANGVGLGWGQVKAPILREDMTSDFKQLAVDRAPSTDFMRHDRVKAIWLSYAAENWRTWVTFNSGANTDNTDFNAMSNADYAFSARVEFLFDGAWSQFADFTSPRGSDFGAMLGLAAHYQGPHNTPAFADVDTSVFLYSADLGLEGDGWNFFGSFIGRHIDADSFAGDAEFDDFSFVLQGGVMLTDAWELFGRFDALMLDDDRGTSEDFFPFLTVGVNHYFAGHAAKATLDLVYSFEKTGDLTGLGLLPNTDQGLLGDTEEGEVVLRAQFQLLF